MRIILSQKQQVNVTHETADKLAYNNNRDKTFITTCLKELRATGETICFKEWHIEELKKHIDIVRIEYDERNECFYVFSKR